MMNDDHFYSFWFGRDRNLSRVSPFCRLTTSVSIQNFSFLLKCLYICLVNATVISAWRFIRHIRIPAFEYSLFPFGAFVDFYFQKRKHTNATILAE